MLGFALAFSLVAITSTAKTVTMPAQTANERSVNGVAGPPPARKPAADRDQSAQPSKKAFKKSKVALPPPLHDPN
jgi:hypothetical protein